MLPHVVFTVEELSVIRNLNNWANLNVQLIGKLTGGVGTYQVEGLHKNSTAAVNLDFSLIEKVPPRSAIIRIWGEIHLAEGSGSPVIKAKIVRMLDSVDLPLYRKSTECRRDYTPHFGRT